MEKIYILSKKYKFKIIEDASHALGAKINNNKIGSCKYSDLAVFSFHPVKMITTAEGGIVTTNNKIIFEKLKMFREHGIVRDKTKFKNKKIKFLETHYEQHELGYNYRLSDIHATLGVSQLKRLNNFIKKRNQINNFYKKELSNFPIKFQNISKKNLSSVHLVIALISKKIRNNFFNYLRRNKIKVNIHYIPIFYHPFYYKKKFLTNKNAIEYYESAISFPAFNDLKKNELKYIIKTIKSYFLKNANKIFKIK